MAGGGLIWLWQGGSEPDTSDILDRGIKKKLLHGLVRSTQAPVKQKQTEQLEERDEEEDDIMLILMAAL